MSPESYFIPSPDLQAKCGAFLLALKAEAVPPPGAIPETLRVVQMQIAVHCLLRSFDMQMAAEDNTADEDAFGTAIKAAMTGIGVGLASYLSNTSAPEFFFEHIVVCCHKSLASFTKTEGPIQ